MITYGSSECLDALTGEKFQSDSAERNSEDGACANDAKNPQAMVVSMLPAPDLAEW